MSRALVGGVALAVGLAAGLALDVSGDDPRVDRLEREIARLSRELAEAREAVDDADGRTRTRVDVTPEDGAAIPAAVSDGAEDRPGGSDADPADAPPADVQLGTVEQRVARVAGIRAQVPVWFERGEGDAVLAALRELAALVPEGREAAMELALRLNEDVSGEGRLGLSDVAFYTGLGDPAVTELFTWALPRADTPSGFRVMAAYSLPWTQPPDETLADLRSALVDEPDAGVQRALVANLGRLRDAEADRLLADVLDDVDRDAAVRAQAASSLAAATDPGIERVLEIVAADDPVEAVRDAARATLVARSPPATGYLVTGTLPESQAAAVGLRAGDVLVRYDGTAVPTVDALRGAAKAAAGRELVPVVLIRDGREVEVLVRPGQLGVYGRSVQAADE